MTITLGPRQRPEPDVLVADAAADTGLDQTTYEPANVLLVIEVVSPDSGGRRAVTFEGLVSVGGADGYVRSGWIIRGLAA
ncbi:Uma2 family endonuclease, partial [Nocardia carnea]|uniref:Uma2 family endonuclease n=1 Tax=Nocardia carnea TaxID=37328 RepID=UPI0024549F15